MGPRKLHVRLDGALVSMRVTVLTDIRCSDRDMRMLQLACGRLGSTQSLLGCTWQTPASAAANTQFACPLV